MDELELKITGIDPMKIETAMHAAHPIMVKEMTDAAQEAADVTANYWREIAPFQTGAYKAGIDADTERMGDIVVGRVFNHERHALWVERGTGFHRSGGGRGGRGYIYPPAGKKAFHWVEDGKGHFARRIRGQRAQWVFRRARIATAPLWSPIFHSHAYDARFKIQRILTG